MPAAAATMSPLVRSLLALTALLAAAEAIAPNPYCNGLQLGKQTDDEITFHLIGSDGVLSIPNKCSGPGRTIVGQYVGTCNTPNYKPEIIPPLQRSQRFPLNFSEVRIICPSDVTGCMRLDVRVTQFCEKFISPHRG